jgi:hypothetical protein
VRQERHPDGLFQTFHAVKWFKADRLWVMMERDADALTAASLERGAPIHLVQAIFRPRRRGHKQSFYLHAIERRVHRGVINDSLGENRLFCLENKSKGRTFVAFSP